MLMEYYSTGKNEVDVRYFWHWLCAIGCDADPNVGAKFIRDLYEKSNDQFHKYSVPVLWDKRTNTIVNNESSEIIRMFTQVLLTLHTTLSTVDLACMTYF